MNSGLPSLLDAIFGKKDLASVSLDEMYEVINEFPSFNAAHLLLSKKLKEQDNSAYLKENTRTALYFNNAFWLQTLLDDGVSGVQSEESVAHGEEIKTGDEDNIWQKENAATLHEEVPVEEETYIEETIAVEPVESAVENFTEEISVEAVHENPESNVADGEAPRAVTSFDELMSKYKIEPDQADFEPVTENVQEDKTESEAAVPFDTAYDSGAHGQYDPVEETPPDEEPDETNRATVPESNTDAYETREEILNDYGIFEEVVVKKTDQDLDDFDPPEDERPAELAVPVETVKTESHPFVEHLTTEQSPEISFDGDYEAFDRPLETTEEAGILEEPIPVPESYGDAAEADDTEKIEEQKTYIPFEAKNAESIVFAPYHMIDYFASQGIKLVQEDQPADHFGRQLKSFTDWLKVMKRLPVQPGSEKTDEREADRIRHFAAHSIEERDILTESMAEVLAKQGMYENAIALYHKLSLIYPPKSAYFASRIEQLKASLP
jgi:hypothetical protein